MRPHVIKLTTSFPEWPLRDQTPGRSGIWKNFRFVIDEPCETCDAWFVYDGLKANETTKCPAANTVFVSAEPASFKRYNSRWLQQFAHVLTAQTDVDHRRVHIAQTSLPWWVGKDYDFLKANPSPPKSKFMSVIASTKTTTAGHRQRLRFIQQLKEANLPGIEYFGRGSRPLTTKWEGLAPYRFSLAIENSSYAHYWTEKIGDCYLAMTAPVYHGAPNIADYFPAESMLKIDINEPEKAISAIRQLCATDEASYLRAAAALQSAKEMTLDRYNLFESLANFCDRLDLNGARETIKLKPEPALSWIEKRWLRLRRRWLGG